MRLKIIFKLMEDQAKEFYDDCIQDVELYTEYATFVFESLKSNPNATSEFLIKKCNEIQQSEASETEKALSILFIRDALLSGNQTFEMLFFKSELLKSFENILQLVSYCNKWEDIKVIFETEEGSRFYIKVLLLMFQEFLSKTDNNAIKLYMQLKDKKVPFHLVEQDPMLKKTYYIEEAKQNGTSNNHSTQYTQIKSSKKPRNEKSIRTSEKHDPINNNEIPRVAKEISSKREEIYVLLKNSNKYKKEEYDKILNINKSIVSLMNSYHDIFSTYIALHIELTDKIESKIKQTHNNPECYADVQHELIKLIENTELELKNLENDDIKSMKTTNLQPFKPGNNQNNDITNICDNLDYNDEPLDIDFPSQLSPLKRNNKNLSVISEMEDTLTNNANTDYYDFDRKTEFNTELKHNNISAAEKDETEIEFENIRNDNKNKDKPIINDYIKLDDKTNLENNKVITETFKNQNVHSFQEYFKNQPNKELVPIKSNIRDKLKKVWERPKSNIVFKMNKNNEGVDKQEVEKLKEENQKLKTELKSSLISNELKLKELVDENKKLNERLKMNEMEYIQKILYMEKQKDGDKDNNDYEDKKDKAVYTDELPLHDLKELKDANDDKINKIKTLNIENVI